MSTTINVFANGDYDAVVGVSSALQCPWLVRSGDQESDQEE